MIDVALPLFGKLFTQLDDLSNRPAAQVISNLDLLWASPEKALGAGEIRVGPRSRWFTRTFWIGAIALTWITCILVALIQQRAWDEKTIKAMCVGGLFSGAIVFIIACVVVEQTRGGQAILSDKGVEFCDGDKSVFCPWPLFRASGQPFTAEATGRLRLPIASSHADTVEFRKGGAVTARGYPIRTGFVDVFQNEMLSDLLEVPIAVWAPLLLRIGNRMSHAVSQECKTPERQVTTTDSGCRSLAGGWLLVQITRLSFPPLCCGCVTYTMTIEDVSIARWQVIGAAVEDRMTIQLPKCMDCQKREACFWLTAWPMLAILGLILVSIGIAYALADSLRFLDFCSIAVCLAIVCPFLGAALGWYWYDLRRSSMRYRRFSPENGTVEIWFRNQTFAAATRSHLGENTSN